MESIEKLHKTTSNWFVLGLFFIAFFLTYGVFAPCIWKAYYLGYVRGHSQY